MGSCNCSTISRSFFTYLSPTNTLHSQEGKIEGVNQETPPNTKIFDPTNRQHTDDVSTLAKRRLAASRENPSQPITVNFPGFAELFAHAKAPPTAFPAPSMPGAASVPNVAPRRRTLLPPTDLAPFCAKYHLSAQIKTKLDAIQIAGPHVLRLISDTDLRGEGALSIGELASVRDAQFRWQDELTN